MEKINPIKTYICYVKSHCEAPDFEQEVEARNIDEAVEIIWGNGQRWLQDGWDKQDIKKYVREMD